MGIPRRQRHPAEARLDPLRALAELRLFAAYEGHHAHVLENAAGHQAAQQDNPHQPDLAVAPLAEQVPVVGSRQEDALDGAGSSLRFFTMA